MDFGTASTAAAYRDRQGELREIPLSTTAAAIPSAVLYTTGRMIQVGEAAVQAGFAEPQAFEPNPKRKLGEPEVLLAGMFAPVTDLVAAVLSDVLAKAAAITGEQPSEVVLTYPAHWSTALQQKLATSGEVAGIDYQKLRLLDGANAAAGFYTTTRGDLPAGARVVVFDFGAGTCDIAALDKQSDGTFTVVASDGFDNLGGLDLDARIRSWVLQQVGARNAALAAELNGPVNATQLQLADNIRTAKEALSSAEAVDVTVSGATGSEQVRLARAEFEQLIRTDIDRVVRLTESVLYQANIVRQVDEPVTIVLTGGSSRIPLVQTRLASLGPIEIPDHPGTVLTYGALLAGPTPQNWTRTKTLEDLPEPRKKKRLRGGARNTDREKTRRRIKITSTMRKWAAGVALVAIIASGVGVTGMMIYQGFFLEEPPPPPSNALLTTTAPPAPKVPTPLEFTVNVVVTENTCAPDGKCQYKYTIEPKYIGQHPLPETPFTVFYEVNGGFAPQPGEFTVHKDQAKILKDVVLDGPPAAKLHAIVKNVTG